MRKWVIGIAMLWTAMGAATAVERKPLSEVDADQFSTQTQATARGAGDDHLSLVWWIPNEFWQSVLSRDATISEADRDATLQAVAGTSLLAIVQAEISTFGAFQFYSKPELESTLGITFTDETGRTRQLRPLENLNPDLELVLAFLKPILASAMGELGNNMHFYVLDDAAQGPAGRLDPYLPGQLDVRLSKKDGTPMQATIEMPVDALFIPRKCPNGKDAHVSWNFCPWSGEALEE